MSAYREFRGASRGRRRSSAALVVLGGILFLAVPFLPWAKGVRSNGEGHVVYDAFELTRLGMDLRILAYLIMGVGLVGVVAGLVILVGPSGLRVPGAVVASLFAFGFTMATGASYAFAQMVVFVFPQLVAASEGGYSVPPALTALAVATVLILGGATLLLRTRPSPRNPCNPWTV